MSPDQIICAVSDVHNVPYREIVGPRRYAKATEARHAAMVYIGDYLRWSTPAIAAAVGRANHTSVLHGRVAHAQRVERNTHSARAKDEACRRRIERGNVVRRPNDYVVVRRTA